MPTGYTADVQDGKITTLREFALACSRAFGALIIMRDNPMDAPIPRQLVPDTRYYDERLAEARKVLDEVPTLSADECEARAKAEFDAAMASHMKYETNRAIARQRYKEMLSRVEHWSVPEEIDGLKKFMIEQLNESIRFDCSEDYKPAPPKRLTGERWREQALEKASRDWAYQSVEREKEIERTKGRNQWLDSLWRSLPAPETPAAAA